jgi:hypothetical protein
LRRHFDDVDVGSPILEPRARDTSVSSVESRTSEHRYAGAEARAEHLKRLKGDRGARALDEGINASIDATRLTLAHLFHAQQWNHLTTVSQK